MTARAKITKADLTRVAKVVAKTGALMRIEFPDGTVINVNPVIHNVMAVAEISDKIAEHLAPDGEENLNASRQAGV
jgi:hypothetical protein